MRLEKNKALASAIQKLIAEYGYAEIYVYCTKDKSLIYTDGTDGKGDYVDYKYYESYKDDKNDIGSGKVVFKFRCYKVEEIKTCERHSAELLVQSCLNADEFYDYLTKNKNFLGRVLGCAIHISDLEIFDKPKELSEFEKIGSYNNPTIKCPKKEQGRCNYGKSPFTGKWCGCEKARLTKAPLINL